ncbi:MAG: oxygen-independent coproporphyrinogen III oxidase [Gammaproteobacteria bacterium]|jgi:oxygen-independent coproporphyrinogen-3 oxidase|nr:oxygen-independent coproporphyrinogen III oxidase [Gammaproteobacteria bacterium]MBK9468181.1 oxygen-independent coproporphyrinogen III oxidase [Gammaproteobacteria bacterium]MBP6481519.1 oxygen-independent coproporphyrinogen III oxidase [Pseudomonadales bacterium]MBP7909804.1 oxygen-independent coproporphyrinogen III oxidase [Pseudomonadales bacterium]
MDIQLARHGFDDRIRWDPALIRKYDVPGPRYTSYPTALQFTDSFGAREYEQYLLERPPVIGPLSLYVHIPYCRNICYYCACNKIVTRDAAVAERYIVALEKETALLSRHFDRRRRVTQLHWGGGTPTFLSPAELTRLMHGLAKHFSLIDAPEREYSIEIDPRSVDTGTIALLKGLGFNRVSMGIQDFDPAVQRAVNRIQPFDMVENLVDAVREHRFKSMSFDLIYGLPLQSPASMEQTLAKVLALDPDRVSCYSYAHLPEIFSSQRSIDRMALPSADEKLEVLHTIIDTLTDAGYLYVGMDHFVKPQDELAQALHNGTLQRNFQGYSTQLAPELLGIGVSSISSTADLYCQNVKTVDEYYALLEQDKLPVQRGLRLTPDDHLRRDVIMQLICRMGIDTGETGERHGIDFGSHFAREMRSLDAMEHEGLLESEGGQIRVTAAGRPLVRNICMVFDAYLDPSRQRFSRTI